MRFPSTTTSAWKRQTFGRSPPRTPAAFWPNFPMAPLSTKCSGSPNSPAYLQGIIDADLRPGRWILTGSQNLALAESVNQSLAGRTAVHHLLPLTRREVVRFAEHPRTLEEALLAGGYPRIFDQALDPSEWLRSYVATYIERDVRTMSQVGDLATFQRFVELCAGRTGQLTNHSTLASDFGVSQPTARAWLAILEAQLYRFPPSAISSEPWQTARQDPQAALLRHRPRLLAHRYPHAAATALAPFARPDIRNLGGLRDRQASAEPRRNAGSLVLPQSGRR